MHELPQWLSILVSVAGFLALIAYHSGKMNKQQEATDAAMTSLTKAFSDRCGGIERKMDELSIFRLESTGKGGELLIQLQQFRETRELCQRNRESIVVIEERATAKALRLDHLERIVEGHTRTLGNLQQGHGFMPGVLGSAGE